MRFDAYSATVVMPDPVGLSSALSDVLGGVCETGRGMYGYSVGTFVRRAGETLATVLYGGRNKGVHVQVQGPESVGAAEYFRREHPGHEVTRADVCVDFDAPGTWSRLSAQALGVARDAGIKIDCRGDWTVTDSPEGQTLYLGAPTSPVRHRLYEKGKQLRGQGAPEGSYSLDHVRFEVQTRPDGPSRSWAATAAPEAFFGLAVWSREVARVALGLDVPRVHVREVRDLDTDRSLRAMAKQYAGVVARRSLELGSSAAAFAEVEQLLRRELERRAES